MNYRWAVAMLMVSSAWAQYAGATAAAEMSATQTIMSSGGGMSVKGMSAVASSAAAASNRASGQTDNTSSPSGISTAAGQPATAASSGAARAQQAAADQKALEVERQAALAPSQPVELAPGIDMQPATIAPLSNPPQFWYTEVNCSGLATHGKYDKRLKVAGGEDGNLVSQLVEGDIVYLTHARGLQPGSDWRVMRRASDPNGSEQFPGQGHWLGSIGQLYQPVGRLHVIRVEKDIAIAQIGFSCEPVEVGDFVIPWRNLGSPRLPETDSVNITQAVAKKAGLVVASKGFVSEMGTSDEIYVNLGQRDNLQQGQRLLIFRRKSSPSTRALYAVSPALSAYGMSGAQTSSDSLINKTKPPAIVGEATVLWVEPKSATAVITYSRGPIFPGDEVGFAITDQALRKPNKPGKNVRQAAANNSRQMVAKR